MLFSSVSKYSFSSVVESRGRSLLADLQHNHEMANMISLRSTFWKSFQPDAPAARFGRNCRWLATLSRRGSMSSRSSNRLLLHRGPEALVAVGVPLGRLLRRVCPCSTLTRGAPALLHALVQAVLALGEDFLMGISSPCVHRHSLYSTMSVSLIPSLTWLCGELGK